MKRKRNSTHSSDSVKKKKQIENSDEATFESLSERRRLEISEIVAEKNRLNIGTSCNINEDYHEDDENYDIEDMKQFQSFVVKEKWRTVEHFQVVPREKVKSALDVLKTDTKNSKKNLSNEEKRLNVLKKHCSRNYSDGLNESDHTWESSMYIIKIIRACILTRNWNNVSHLLLMLFKYRKAYVPFIKQAAFLNFICNPDDYNSEILQEFFELCMMRKPAHSTPEKLNDS